MSTYLNDLPSELLLLILEYISIGHRSVPALSSLCLTSRRLRSLAEPYLYASFSNKKQIDRPHLFPLSLINRPSLADHVREIDLHVPYRGYPDPVPEDVLRLLQGAIEGLNLPSSVTRDSKQSLEFLAASRIATCAELSLILASRNLERLSLYLKSFDGIVRHEPFFMTSHILFETPNWVGRFEQVRSVSITFSSFNRGIYDLAFVFKMPSLRCVEFTGCEERSLGQALGWNIYGELEANLGQWQHVYDSGVDSITLRACDIGHCAINVLLNCCKVIRSLYIEVDLLNSEWGLFRFSRLQDALCRHADSLEQLVIVQEKKNKERQRSLGFRDSGPLTFLPQLCKLRTAVVPLRALAAVPDTPDTNALLDENDWSFDEADAREHLPPSPESISIRDYNVHYGITSHLFELA
ncbi:hypothetical protein BU23DRAFT_203145 [Bimuria novae-zelandiae CBS 107.79]|uniref:F-box domain-containing protein n=1 Tax=Bimuria novae-zelandiae CBS 107.79 TaxID=1447943 RepID=A0A6A5V1B4_9PLEO|nr:hypothetical protein BU23DRAFT_203145 [Bimuria novae-zelandiae CBS 107.79]